MLGEVLERKQTRNSSAISRYSGAIFRNSGAIPKSVQSQSSATQSVHLHVFDFTIFRALICHESSRKHLCSNGSCRSYGLFGRDEGTSSNFLTGVFLVPKGSNVNQVCVGDTACAPVLWSNLDSP